MRIFLLLFILLMAQGLAAQDAGPETGLADIVAMEARAAGRKLAPSGMRVTASDNYDVKYYRCEWEVDPAVNYIRGAVTPHFVMKAAGNIVSFDLTSALTVTSVKLRGSDVPFVHANDALTITMPNALTEGAKDSLTIRYEGKPPASGAFVQSYHGAGAPYVWAPVLWTLSEPFGSRDWWPCKNGLNDKADSLDIYMIHPAGYKAASNGLLQTETSMAGSKIRTHWKHRYPIASYLVAMAVTNYNVLADTVAIGGSAVPFMTYCYPESQTAFQNGAQTAMKAMTQFSALFGDYPFKKEKYGHVQFGWGGGMEHQTCSFMVNMSERLITHELAHQWFGDKVTCASWQDIWLNEGFASFLAELYDESQHPANVVTSRKAVIDYITSKPDGSVWVDDITNVNRIFDQRLSYAKGSHLLYMLRWILGDEAFFSAVNNYLQDPALAYGYATTAHLKTHFEAVSGKDLTYFFNQWFTGQGYPSYQLEWFPNGNSVQVKLGQTQSHASVGFFELPVPVLFRNAATNQQKLVVLAHGASGQLFTENLGFEATEAILDPEAWLITRNNTITKTAGPLPVTFTAFDVTCAGSSARLSWQTSEERHADHFEILASPDARHWESLGTVPAAGNTTATSHYHFGIENAARYRFYRIREHDVDGQMQETRIVAAACKSEEVPWTIYPNPVDKQLTISARRGTPMPEKLFLVDIRGRRIALSPLLQTADSITVNVIDLTPGLYWISAPDGKLLGKFLKY